MFDYTDIKEANTLIKTVPIKGKEYAQVPDRVKAFRSFCPMGAIVTEILDLNEDRVVMKATVLDEAGNTLGTGHAYELQASSFINKTSYIENCETSAVGRALGFLSIGSDASIASAEEVENAINNQKKSPVRVESSVDTIKELCEITKVSAQKILDKYNTNRADKYTDLAQLTPEELADAIQLLEIRKTKLGK